jgi:hypothetical protein
MRKLAFPIALSGLVLAACAKEDPPPPARRVECTTDDCRPLKAKPLSAMTVENRSRARVDLRVTIGDALRVDRRVVDGTLAVPIPSAANGAEGLLSIEPGKSRSLDGNVVVVNAAGRNDTVAGAFIRVTGGPPFLALGVGTIFVRASADGAPFLEAEDPKMLSLVPADRAVTECATGELEAPFDSPPTVLHDAIGESEGPIRVRGVARDAQGCREIVVGDDRVSPIATLRACLPDEAYPVADGDELLVRASGDPTNTSSLRLLATNGDELILTRVVFGARTSQDADGLELGFTEDASCVRVDAPCGHVDVPATITARTSAGTVHPIVYGQPIDDIDLRRRFFVLAASARPVAGKECSDHDDPGSLTAIARVWLVTVSRAK